MCTSMENLNLIHLLILEIQSMLEKTMAKLATPISDQKFFDQVSIFVNLHQHAKNQANSSISSGDIVDLKTLQPDWLRGFSPISQEQDFP